MWGGVDARPRMQRERCSGAVDGIVGKATGPVNRSGPKANDCRESDVLKLARTCRTGRHLAHRLNPGPVLCEGAGCPSGVVPYGSSRPVASTPCPRSARRRGSTARARAAPCAPGSVPRRTTPTAAGPPRRGRVPPWRGSRGREPTRARTRSAASTANSAALRRVRRSGPTGTDRPRKRAGAVVAAVRRAPGDRPGGQSPRRKQLPCRNPRLPVGAGPNPIDPVHERRFWCS